MMESPEKREYDHIPTGTDMNILQLSTAWLLDKHIGFYFEYLKFEFLRSREDILFIDPSASHAVLLTEEPNEILLPLELPGKKFIFMAINDKQEDEPDEIRSSSQSESTTSSEPGGNHWAFMLFDREQNKLRYYDSDDLENYTTAGVLSRAMKNALKLLEKLEVFLNIDLDFNVEENSPKQINGYDCGLYVCAVAHAVAQHLIRNDFRADEEDSFAYITPEYIFDLRFTMGDIIIQERLKM